MVRLIEVENLRSRAPPVANTRFKGFDHLFRTIVGALIDDDDLLRSARLCQQGWHQQRAELLRAILCRDNDGTSHLRMLLLAPAGPKLLNPRAPRRGYPSDATASPDCPDGCGLWLPVSDPAF